MVWNISYIVAHFEVHSSIGNIFVYLCVKSICFKDIAADCSLEQPGVSLTCLMTMKENTFVFAIGFWCLHAPSKNIIDSAPRSRDQESHTSSFRQCELLCTWGGGDFLVKNKKNPSGPFLAVKMLPKPCWNRNVYRGSCDVLFIWNKQMCALSWTTKGGIFVINSHFLPDFEKMPKSRRLLSFLGVKLPQFKAFHYSLASELLNTY